MALSLGQGLLDLSADGRGRAAFPFEKPQPVPKPDDFPFSCGVHDRSLQSTRLEQNMNMTSR